MAHGRINVKKTPDLMCSDLANSHFAFTVPLDNLQHLHMQHHCPVLGNQLESELEKGHCFGIAANADFILVCTYEENGENPELIVYKKR